jgi:plastocyanin
MHTSWKVLAAAFLLLASGAGKGFAGTVEGTVVLKAQEKPKHPPRYYLGPYRSARGESADTAAFGEVVVFLQGETLNRKYPPPAQPLKMVQRGQQFVPRVLPVLAGTTVEFPNEDNFYHNVFSVAGGERFDLGRFGQGGSASQTFSRPAVVVVHCEIHADMKAYILVLDNPFFAQPDPGGRFRLSEVPAGAYTLKAWHPTQGEQSVQVVVPETGTVEVGLSL